MLILGYNTLQYYKDKSLQRWEISDNKNIFVYFKINVLPSFILISNTIASTATAQIYNAIDDSPVGSAYPVTITIAGGQKTLKIENIEIIGGVEGCYYTKIIAGTDIFYSEVYKWVADDIETQKKYGLLKIVAESANITIGSNYNIESFTYSCFIAVNPPIISDNITEIGSEKPYGDVALFGTRTIKRKFEIIGGIEIFKFLSGLRILNINGSIIFTYDGISYSGIDIKFEKTETISFDNAILMTLEFTESDYISPRNEI